MSFIPMVKSQGSYHERKCDHPRFEEIIVNNIDPEQWKAGQN
jgi:hypothetical protein